MKFKCEICGKEWSRQDKLKEHMSDIHYRSSEFECPVCERKLVEEETCRRTKKSVAKVDTATNNFPRHRSF